MSELVKTYGYCQNTTCVAFGTAVYLSPQDKNVSIQLETCTKCGKRLLVSNLNDSPTTNILPVIGPPLLKNPIVYLGPYIECKSPHTIYNRAIIASVAVEEIRQQVSENLVPVSITYESMGLKRFYHLWVDKSSQSSGRWLVNISSTVVSEIPILKLPEEKFNLVNLYTDDLVTLKKLYGPHSVVVKWGLVVYEPE